MLIIDHIFDWARDDYRNRILSQLRSLSETTTDESDYDIASTRPPFATEGDEVSSEGINNLSPQEGREKPQIPSLHSLSSDACSIREKSDIECRFLGLFITRDNIMTLLQSLGIGSEVRNVAFELVSAVAGQSIMCTGKQLESLKELWTGDGPHRSTRSMQQTKFYTKLNYRAWLAQNWAPIRQLTCLAVAPSALDRLAEVAELKQRPEMLEFEFEWENVFRIFEHLSATSTRFDLLAAISRHSLSLVVRAKDSYRWLGLVERHSDEIHVVIDTAYNRLQIANQETSEPYFHQSTHVRRQTLGYEPECDPWRLENVLRPTREGHVLVVDDHLESKY